MVDNTNKPGESLKMLIVGGGSAGVRHFRNLSELGVDCDVCDPNSQCRVIQQYPDAIQIPDYDSAALSNYDAVVICTPPSMHIPQLIKAAQAGCHLLSEKPLTVLNNDGLDELQKLIEEKGLVTSVAFPYATMKAMDRIIDIVESGQFGAVRSVSIHEGQDILKPRPDYFQTYYVSDHMGGGALQDDALHPLFGLERLFGPELEVTCQRHNVGIQKEGVTADDTAWMWIRFENDVVATIDFSLQCHWKHNEWILNLETGAIKLHVDQSRIEILDAETGNTTEQLFDDDWNATFQANDLNFVEAIRGVAEVKCDLSTAIVNHKAILAARLSASLGRTVKVDEIGFLNS